VFPGAAHAEPERSGTLLCQDTFYIGWHKGVGKVHRHVAVDTYGGYAFGFLHVFKQTEAAVAAPQGDVLSFHRAHGPRVEAALMLVIRPAGFWPLWPGQTPLAARAASARKEGPASPGPEPSGPSEGPPGQAFRGHGKRAGIDAPILGLHPPGGVTSVTFGEKKPQPGLGLSGWLLGGGRGGWGDEGSRRPGNPCIGRRRRDLRPAQAPRPGRAPARAPPQETRRASSAA